MKEELHLNKPLISVVIPIHNSENTLKRCLQSVLAQNLSQIEIICVDDGSVDHSLLIAQNFAQTDPRIIVLSQSNQGAACARNVGIQQARGEYVFFLDSDDTMLPDACEKLAGLIGKHSFDVCMFLFRYLNEQDSETLDYPCFPVQTGRERTYLTNVHQDPSLLLRTSVVPWNKIYRTEFLRKHELFFEKFYCSEDRLFFFQALLNADSVLLYNEPLVLYHLSSNPSLSKEAGLENLIANIKANRKIEAVSQNQESEIQSIIQDILHNEIILCLRKTRKEDRQEAFALLRDEIPQMNHSHVPLNPESRPWYAEYEVIRSAPDHYREIRERLIPVIIPYDPLRQSGFADQLSFRTNTFPADHIFDIYIFHNNTLRRESDIRRIKAQLESSNKLLHVVNIHQALTDSKGSRKKYLSRTENYAQFAPLLIHQYESFYTVQSDRQLCLLQISLPKNTASKFNELIVDFQISSFGETRPKIVYYLFAHQYNPFPGFILRMIPRQWKKV